MMRVSRVLRAIGPRGLLQRSRCCQQRRVAEPHYTTAELRQLLQEQRRNSALPPSEVMATAGRLAMALAESSDTAERLEGLKRAEELWQELAADDCPLPAISQLTMKMLLSSTMHRCATACGHKALIACWADRFAERKTAFTVENFLDASQDDDAMSAALNRTRSTNTTNKEDDDEEERMMRPDPRFGFTAEDIAEEAKEAQAKKKSEASAQRRPPTPLQRLQRDMMLEHPVVQIRERSPMPFGPRYT